MNNGYNPFPELAEQIYTRFTQRQETEVQRELNKTQDSMSS